MYISTYGGTGKSAFQVQRVCNYTKYFCAADVCSATTSTGRTARLGGLAATCSSRFQSSDAGLIMSFLTTTTTTYARGLHLLPFYQL